MKEYQATNTRRTAGSIAAVLAVAAGATLGAALTVVSPTAQAASVHYALPDLGSFDT
jgi:hypothetical protein